MYGAAQRCPGKRFLQEMNVCRQHPVRSDHISRITRHIEKLEVWAYLLESNGEIPAIHLREVFDSSLRTAIQRFDQKETTALCSSGG
jgi:hypothetical protein